MQNPSKPGMTLPDREHFLLFLLIGQSNMAGRGSVDEEGQTPHPRVLSFSAQGEWVPATDPLHSDKPTAGTGPGLSFGKRVADALSECTIGLVPCAVGGTPLSRWQKGADLYEQAVARCRAAMKDGRLAAILWHQGESDAQRPEDAETYADRLAQMIVDLRSDLGSPDVPFLAGEIGYFLDHHPNQRFPKWREVNAALAEVAKRLPKVVCVSAMGLGHTGDGVHLDTPSQRELGRRYAAEYLRLIEG